MICVILLMVRHKIKPFKIFDKPQYERTYVDERVKPIITVCHHSLHLSQLYL